MEQRFTAAQVGTALIESIGVGVVNGFCGNLHHIVVLARIGKNGKVNVYALSLVIDVNPGVFLLGNTFAKRISMDLHIAGLYVEYVRQGLCGECGSVCRVRDIQSNAIARIHCRKWFGRQIAGTVRHEDKRITVALVQLPFYFGIRQELSSLSVFC